MSKLKAVAPASVKPAKPKMLIFGKAGYGKTWASLDFPKVYYIDTEGGATRAEYQDKLKKAGGAYLGVSEGSLDFEVIIAQIQALATEKHEYKTLVIDSITKIYNEYIGKEAERLGKDDVFGASKKPAIKYMRTLISWLSRLDMNVILISHEKSLWGKDAKGNQTEIGKTADAWDKLEYELDLCMQIIKTGISRKAIITKSRLKEFPEGNTIEWSYNEFATRYGMEILEREGESIVLITPEQLSTINTLLDVVKVADDFIEKCLKKAQAETLAEITTDQAEAIINALKAKKGE